VQHQTIGRELADNARREVAVDLDDGKPAYSLEQWSSERAKAGADLDDVVVALGIDGGDDALDVVRVNQEILAKPLARDMAVNGAQVRSSRQSAKPPLAARA
jgi:hypothetical protein